MGLKIVSAVVVAICSCLVFLFQQCQRRGSSDSIACGRNTNQRVYDNNNSSSVWCSYDKTYSKMCTFRNLCYLPETRHFAFILTNESHIHGLNSNSDLKTISLSSVDKHNNMYMKIQIVMDYSKHLANYNVLRIDEPILLMNRFKPDNIMHVIHDDVLPLFMFYNHLCSGDIEQCIKIYRLMFTDDVDDIHHAEWYRILSNKKPFNLNSLRMFTCFDKISVGLPRETVWYQYGFNEHHGPVASATIDSILINRFKNFVIDNFQINRTLGTDLHTSNAVLLSRKSNRKILNEKFVLTKMYEVFKSEYQRVEKLKLHVLDPSQNSSIDMITTIMKSQILVGIHGSAMIYSLFLPKDAVIVELFPFGIQPQHVSPIRALSQLPGTFYNYLSWRNFKESNSVVYPERTSLLGGIHHLSDEEQVRIRELKEIPPVKCCHDPAYLYRMFQDTVVDENFPVILKQALINQKEMIQYDTKTLLKEYLRHTWFFPGPVSYLSCRTDQQMGMVFIDWLGPFNIETNNFRTSVSFLGTVKIFLRVVTFETYSFKTTVKLTAEEKNMITKNTDVQVWVRALTDNIEGIEVHSYC